MAARVFGLTSLALLCAAAAGAGQPGFSVKPSAKRDGNKVRISFAVTHATDVEVSVLDAGVKIVRRLAAGKLGARPVRLLQPGLSQELVWDGTDDAGRKAVGGPFKIRVGLGLRARLHRVIGWSGQKLGETNGMAVGPDGTFYVMHSGRLYAHRQTWLITAFDRKGKYLRQVFPGPAGLPPEKRKGWPRVTLPDGGKTPVIFQLLARTTYPGAVMGSRMFPVVTRDGRLIVLSGPGHTTIKHDDFRGGRRLLILGTDGSVPENFLGPVVCPMVGGFGHIALSPDEKYVYATGLVSTGRKGKGNQNVVYRLALNGSEKSKVFIGKLYGKGDGRNRLNDPQGIDVDRAGNIYVADYGNNRVAVFKPDGDYLDELKVDRPDTLRVSRKTGAVYVTQIKARRKPVTDPHWYTVGYNWSSAKVVKLGGLRNKKEIASWSGRLSPSTLIALDETGRETVLWVGGMKHRGSPIVKFVDRGTTLQLVGEPIRDLGGKDGFEPVGYVADAAVIGEKLITGQPIAGNQSNKSPMYSTETGKFLGHYIPRKADGKSTESAWHFYGEAVAGKDGNMYYHHKTWRIRRYDIGGLQLPFSTAKDKNGKPANFVTGLHHGHTRGAGLFVNRRGTIYAPAGTGSRKIEDMKVKVFGADGKLKNDCAVHVQNARMGGIAVDRAGNIYLGAQAAPRKQRVPKWFAGKLPKDSPAHHPGIDYKNYGTIFKFPPTGGAIALDPAGSHTAIAQYKRRSVSVRKALWSRRLGYIGSHGGDLGCHCETTRFDIDGYDRILAPDIFRFRVYVLDSAGNEITHFGSYGNMDSRGKGSPVPSPEIAWAWPLNVECAGGRAYVSDVVNKRIVSVRFEHAVRAECAVE